MRAELILSNRHTDRQTDRQTVEETEGHDIIGVPRDYVNAPEYEQTSFVTMLYSEENNISQMCHLFATNPTCADLAKIPCSERPATDRLNYNKSL